MESKNYQEELAHIRQMMERSSRFISLSGLSGVIAGIVALLGSVYVYFIFQREGIDYFDGERNIYGPALAKELFFVALVVLILAISNNHLFTAALQIALPYTIIQQTIRLFVFRNRVENVCKGFQRIFSTNNKKTLELIAWYFF